MLNKHAFPEGAFYPRSPSPVRFLDFPMLLIRPRETVLEDTAVEVGVPDLYPFGAGKACILSSTAEELAVQLDEVCGPCLSPFLPAPRFPLSRPSTSFIYPIAE